MSDLWFKQRFLFEHTESRSGGFSSTRIGFQSEFRIPLEHLNEVELVPRAALDRVERQQSPVRVIYSEPVNALGAESRIRPGIGFQQNQQNQLGRIKPSTVASMASLAHEKPLLIEHEQSQRKEPLFEGVRSRIKR